MSTCFACEHVLGLPTFWSTYIESEKPVRFSWLAALAVAPPVLRTPSATRLALWHSVSGTERKDAQRNREAILCAARELFADCADVPMYEVARRAGVGQATLYRHFPDRRDLAAAVLVEEMESTEQLAVEHAGDPDAFFLLLRDVVETMACFYPWASLHGRMPASARRSIAPAAAPRVHARAAPRGQGGRHGALRSDHR